MHVFCFDENQNLFQKEIHNLMNIKQFLESSCICSLEKLNFEDSHITFLQKTQVILSEVNYGLQYIKCQKSILRHESMYIMFNYNTKVLTFLNSNVFIGSPAGYCQVQVSLLYHLFEHISSENSFIQKIIVNNVGGLLNNC